MAASSKNRGRILVYLALILIFGIILIYFLYINPQMQAAQQPSVAPTPVEEMSNIVISIQSIPFGSVITGEMVTTIPYPKKNLVPNVFFSDTTEVIGKRASMTIEAKVPITTAIITDQSTGSAVSMKIPSGMVAVSIPIDNPLTGVGYFLQPGDHVNIIGTMMLVDVDTEFQSKTVNNAVFTNAATYPPELFNVQGRFELQPSINESIFVYPSEPQRPRIVSQTIVSNAQVLEVGEYSPPQPEVATQPEATATPAPAEPAVVVVSQPQIVTLIVTPQEAVAINYLMYTGVRMNLALRSASDDVKNDTESVTLQYIMDTFKVKMPVKLPYGIEPAVNTLNLPNEEPAPTPY